jgi:hypothetical protein
MTCGARSFSVQPTNHTTESGLTGNELIKTATHTSSPATNNNIGESTGEERAMEEARGDDMQAVRPTNKASSPVDTNTKQGSTFVGLSFYKITPTHSIMPKKGASQDGEDNERQGKHQHMMSHLQIVWSWYKDFFY